MKSRDNNTCNQDNLSSSELRTPEVNNTKVHHPQLIYKFILCSSMHYENRTWFQWHRDLKAILPKLKRSFYIFPDTCTCMC